MIAPVKAAKMTAGSTIFGSMMPEPTVFATRTPKKKMKSDEVEERRPYRREARGQDSRRYYGGNRVGGVVQPVQEIEQ